MRLRAGESKAICELTTHDIGSILFHEACEPFLMGGYHDGRCSVLAREPLNTACLSHRGAAFSFLTHFYFQFPSLCLIVCKGQVPQRCQHNEQRKVGVRVPDRPNTTQGPACS